MAIAQTSTRVAPAAFMTRASSEVVTPVVAKLNTHKLFPFSLTSRVY